MNRPNSIATTADFEFAALDEARNYRRAIVHEFGPCLRGRVLEVGAGLGQMTGEFLASGGIDEIVCVEPESRFATEHSRRFPGIRMTIGTVVDLPQEAVADCVVSVNVLEHIEDDACELKRYAGLLSSREGSLCVLVPARPEIYSPLDSDFGHYRRYRKKELREKLEAAGFHVLKIHYFNSVGYLAWWFSFCLLRQRSFSRRSVWFYDRCIFPLVNCAERFLIRPPIGQSLVALARVSCRYDTRAATLPE
jgi:SAM-dependent methyltransferase